MQQSLTYPDLTYPERPAYFAMRAIRGAILAGMVESLGPRAFALFVIIADLEDQLRYRRPPNFTNQQLGTLLDLHPDTVEDVRSKLVAAGWLAYRSRHRRPGVYWVTIPPAWEEAAGLVGPWSVSTPDNTPTKTPTNTPDNTPTLHSYPSSSSISHPSASTEGGAAAEGIVRGQTQTPTENSASTEWEAETEAAVERELIELLKTAGVQVAPGKIIRRALQQGRTADEIRSRIRHFLDQGTWLPGFLVFTLRSPDYVGRPADYGWPSADPELLAKRDRDRRASAATATVEQALCDRQRDARLRQLTLQFDGRLRARPTRDIVASFDLPETIRARLMVYPTWDAVRDDRLRLAVLESVAAAENRRN